MSDPRRRAALAVGAVGLVLGVVLVIAAVIGLPPWPRESALGAPHFVEEATTAGIDHRYAGDFPYVVGGGVAVFDCNDDGRHELYLAGGADPAVLYRNDSRVGGKLQFSQIPGPITDLTEVTGAYPLDIDGDGRTDLAVLRIGPNVVLRGLGNCEFEQANADWGLDGGDVSTTAFSATWEGSAAWPTLAFGNYRNEASNDLERLCYDNELVRPNAAQDGFAAGAPLTPSWCALSMLFSDWDRSGRRDLRVSNDRHYYSGPGGEEQLWRIQPGATPRLWTRAEGWQPLRVWGMGIASQDLTGDGLPEIYLTSQGDNKLQTLADGSAAPRYQDIAVARAVTATHPYAGDIDLLSTAWHPEFDDVNNDALMDLFVSKGNVDALADYAMRDPSNLFIGQTDGIFSEGAEAAGIVSFSLARGAALADLNLDGLLDLIVVNRRENVKLWRSLGGGTLDSPTPMGNWIALDLREAGPNRNAIGAWIEVRAGDRTTWREVTVGGGHAGGQLGWIHIGLGTAEEADVIVHWPDGEAGPTMTVKANRLYEVERGTTEANPWTPGS